ncbi:MAG TPA: hypothetical protein VG826_01650 [Pirellulales bacterium]|nr:hypothetical protein [Pirellulales bacterium]
MQQAVLPGRGAGAQELTIAALGSVNLTVPELAAIRQQSVPRFCERLKPQLLKHSDEQTLAAIAALAQAIEQMPPCQAADRFANWGVVSATRYLGRTAFATVIDRYKVDGPWGVSVQVIPHTSPHAVASTLGMALDSHGPCAGAGGAPGEETQVVLAAASLLRRRAVSGMWMIFSGWRYPAQGATQTADAEPVCLAAALAVVDTSTPRADDLGTIGRIHIQPCSARATTTAGKPTHDLIHWLTGRDRRSPTAQRIALGSMSVEIELHANSPNGNGAAVFVPQFAGNNPLGQPAFAATR